MTTVNRLTPPTDYQQIEHNNRQLCQHFYDNLSFPRIFICTFVSDK